MVANLLKTIEKEKVNAKLDKMSWKGGKAIFFQSGKPIKCCS